jgi:CRISPR-associated endonuclease/helicase Cas3
MSELRRQVGRVVFNTEQSWVVLTLKCHVDNVTKLVEVWDSERAYLTNLPPTLSQSHQLTIEAARVHDMGKPSHFRLTYEGFRNGPPQWGYSFAGHRFVVTHENRYVELLGRLHHEYSVEGINRAIAELCHLEQFKDIAIHLPIDLYTLEMADQIEATVARAAVGAEDPEERVFMDFAFTCKDKDNAEYHIDPFPFRENPVRLTIEYAQLTLPATKVIAVQTAKPNEKSALLRNLQGWLEDALQNVPLHMKEIYLWPWI